jgi:hypothetical protein
MRFMLRPHALSLATTPGAFASGYRKPHGCSILRRWIATSRAPVLLQVFQRFDTTAGRGSACLVISVAGPASRML